MYSKKTLANADRWDLPIRRAQQSDVKEGSWKQNVDEQGLDTCKIMH